MKKLSNFTAKVVGKVNTIKSSKYFKAGVIAAVAITTIAATAYGIAYTISSKNVETVSDDMINLSDVEINDIAA